MIATILLVIIYLSFISLGLPDSIIGVSIPAFREEWGISLSLGGLISTVTVSCMIVSSFISSMLIKKIGTGRIIFLSCLATGAALFGYSLSRSFYLLLVLALPLGFGSGSVDAALNNYVALNYKARHMNWLHSFWGLGATLGPIVMAYSITNLSWRAGFRTISLLQLSLAAVLFISLPLWKKKTADTEGKEAWQKDEAVIPSALQLLRVPGVIPVLLTMLLYVSAEASIGLWGSSFLIKARGLTMEKAASWMAFYYGGITAGRLLSGFVSFRLSNIQMIWLGVAVSSLGVLAMALPLPAIATGIAIIAAGVGFSPIFPAMLHQTPVRFGKLYSQVIIGYQMGFAGIGGAFVSPLIGVILQHTWMPLFPVYVAVILGFMILAIFLANRKTSKAVK